MNEALLVSNGLLWLCLVALSAVVFALVRQVGVLHERITPAGALMPGRGPSVGRAAPTATALDLDGRPVTIGGEAGDGLATLLFFLSPTCPVCKTLLPTLLRVAAEQAPAVRVVLASDGEPSEHLAFVRERGLAGLPYLLSAELGISYQVGKLPYAVLIDRRGIVRAHGIVNTREHLESLFEADRYGVASVQEYLRGLSDDDRDGRSKRATTPSRSDKEQAA